MNLLGTFSDLLERSERSEEYWLDIAVTDFACDLNQRIKQLDVTHHEIAERLGTSRPYVTKLLNGGNFTLHTMVKLAMALDAVVRVRLEGREERRARHEVAAAVAASASDIADFTEWRQSRSQRVVGALGGPPQPRFSDRQGPMVAAGPEPRIGDTRPSPFPHRDYQRQRMSGATQ